MVLDMPDSQDPAQCGNRKGRSATHFVAQLIHFLLNEAVAGRSVNFLVVVDYPKAFDRMDITVFMKHLVHLNVRAELVPWIADFLTNRQHYVKLTTGQLSDWKPKTCGVP